MKKLAAFALTTLVLFSYLLPYGFSQTDRTYQILNHPDGLMTYSLTVTVQQSLYEYYHFSKSHELSSPSDFPKYVTPDAVKPIANCLWDVYADEEDFVNGVLMIIHQIQYSESDAKYPVETIVENTGDCDVLSYMAASIIMAGGLEVILIYYESQAHMNVGVKLAHPPQDARYTVRYVIYNGARYYICECTGDDWRNGWRIGECPPELVPALKNAKIITLENCEQNAPGQVSASYNTLVSSAISLTVSSPFVIEGSSLTISGRLSPAVPNRTITIYLSVGGSSWTVIGTATTNINGEFQYIWNANMTGICSIRASWSGDGEYAGADSPTQIVTVLSIFLTMLIALAAVTLTIVGLAIFLSRQSKPTVPEVPPLETPP